MALIYGLSGSITLEGISAGLVSNTSGAHYGSLGLVVALTLTIVGFGFKLSAVPFHMWVPDVYEGAPTPVVAFLSVASKAAGFALVLRFFYIGLYDVAINWSVLFAVIAAISMTVGNLLAIPQSNIKRLFGYSTVAHAGYIMVGLAAVSYGEELSAGPSSVLFYLVAYAAANLTALLAINQISDGVGSDDIEDYSGVAYKSPMLAIVLTIALMALIGVPPTGIFIAKIYIFTAAVNNGLMWLAVIGVANSVISAYYYLRVVRVMFRGNNNQCAEKIISGIPVKVAILISAAVTVYLGISPNQLFGAAENAVKIFGNLVQ
jgi:NADH-quinone oxidoreductase subunit N